MVISVLVYANDEEGALSEAGGILDNLCGEGNEFDYYSTFNNEHASERWGEKSPATKICADLGSDRCDKCNERFHCYTTQINSDFKFRCNQAGAYIGPCVRLYDQDGEGIRERKHLQNVLNKWACNNSGKPDPELEGLNLYIVPADVHY